MESSSNPGLSLEERLRELQTELTKLKKIVQQKIRSRDSKWDQLNNALVALHEEFKDATKAQFKDQANTNGEFGNRLCTLEIEVNRLARSQVTAKNDDED